MVDEDLKMAERDALVSRQGFKAYQYHEWDARIFVAGHRGLVGSAIVRRLQAGRIQELGHCGAGKSWTWPMQPPWPSFLPQRPEYVFDAPPRKSAASWPTTVIPADFLLDNLKIQNNLIESSWRSGVKKFLFLGSSCIYPKHAPQPMKEEYLLTGPHGADQRVVRDRQDRRVSSSARRSASSTASTPSASCRPTSTAPATTSTCRDPMCCRR
jgi:hypothetical protein